MHIIETIKTEITEQYDVAVCGGGIAGIAAALAAAREGKKVVLIEKQFMLGGLATAGLITIYLPLCDGKGRQVSFGLAEELLRLSITYGAENLYPENWLDGKGTRSEKDKRFEVQYNAQLFAILAEQELKKEGVDIRYGSFVVGASMQGKSIEALLVESKSGREAFAVGAVVDATGDADIAHFAGAPTELFEQGNVLAGWYYSSSKAGYKLHMVGAADIPDEDKTAEEKEKRRHVERFLGLSGKELSQMTQKSHAATLHHFLAARGENDDFMLATLPTIPQIRMTRKLVGEYTLSAGETHTYFEDSIGMVSNWKKRGPVYEVPFGTLFNKSVKNLIMAGRCTSVDQTLWDVMRVIPCCAVTGEAAGVAAAMTNDFSTLDVKALQAKLTQKGVVLHEKDLPAQINL